MIGYVGNVSSIKLARRFFCFLEHGYAGAAVWVHCDSMGHYIVDFDRSSRGLCFHQYSELFEVMQWMVVKRHAIHYLSRCCWFSWNLVIRQINFHRECLRAAELNITSLFVCLLLPNCASRVCFSIHPSSSHLLFMEDILFCEAMNSIGTWLDGKHEKD